VTESRQDLPNKLYFKIGEVASIVGVKPYVLRYWESEFSCIRPTKTRTQHRLYRRRDIEVLLEIKRLLYGERFTIAGARRHLKGLQKKPSRPAAAPAGERAYRSILAQVRKELESLHRMLS
jgi:DNA-binding transcriptional MerR regulator